MNYDIYDVILEHRKEFINEHKENPTKIYLGLKQYKQVVFICRAEYGIDEYSEFLGCKIEIMPAYNYLMFGFSDPVKQEQLAYKIFQKEADQCKDRLEKLISVKGE